MKSRGWALILETIEKEANQVLTKMADPSPLTVDDIHYLRGVLFSALEVKNIPTNLKRQIEADHLIALAKEKEAEK